eukprot:8836611-Karenia_brevis.AAC.1
MAISFSAAITACKGCVNIALATANHACQILFDVYMLECLSHASPVGFDVIAVAINCKGLELKMFS